MKKLVFMTLGAAFLVSTFAVADHDNDKNRLSASLKSFDEVPAAVTTGTGTFSATFTDTTLTFKLTYKNLSTPAVQSHIHVGASRTNGGVAIFFCGPAAPATQPCPSDATNSGTVTGTLTAADVIINGQGIAPGEFAKVLRAIANGVTYVNVHTQRLPGGEIRGQVKSSDDEDDD